jgi:hypothetical protein
MYANNEYTDKICEICDKQEITRADFYRRASALYTIECEVEEGDKRIAWIDSDNNILQVMTINEKIEATPANDQPSSTFLG